jgi:hypothetical protein
LKLPNTIRAGGVAQGVGPEFKSQYWEKQTNKKQSACMMESRSPNFKNLQRRNDLLIDDI